MIPTPVPEDLGLERCSPPHRATGQKSQEWNLFPESDGILGIAKPSCRDEPSLAN